MKPETIASEMQNSWNKALNILLVFVLIPPAAGAVLLTRFGTVPYAFNGKSVLSSISTPSSGGSLYDEDIVEDIVVADVMEDEILTDDVDAIATESDDEDMSTTL